MAVRISRLAILLGVDQKGLSTGLKKGEAEVKGFAARLSGIGASLRSALAFAPIAAEIGLVTKAFSNFAETGDRFNKLALRTGISAELLQGFAFAAERSGTDVERVADAIKDMAERLEQFRAGTGEATKAFERLGFQFSDFINLSVEERFLRIGDALSKIEDASERSALAARVFGESGVQLLAFFSEGEDGIRSLLDRFDELGGALEAQDELAAGYKDAVTDLTTALKGLGNELSVAIAPAITEVTNSLAEGIAGFREYRAAAVESLFGPGGFFDDPGRIIGNALGRAVGFGSVFDVGARRNLASAPIPGRSTGRQNRASDLLFTEPPDFSGFGTDVAAFGKTAFDAFTEPFKRLPDTAKGIAKEFAAGFADAFDGLQKVQAVRRQFAFDQFARQISETLGGPAGVSFGQAGAVRAGTVEAAQIQLDAQTRNAELQASQQIIKETQTTNRILGEIAARQILDSPAVLSLASIPGA